MHPWVMPSALIVVVKVMHRVRGGQRWQRRCCVSTLLLFRVSAYVETRPEMGSNFVKLSVEM